LFLRGKDNSPSPLGRKQLSPLLPQEIWLSTFLFVITFSS
jgi:hypothetical protein